MPELPRAFSQPEYLHVVLNHWPIWGLLMGLLVLAVAFFQRSPATRWAAQLVILLCALSVYPIAASGEKAESQVEGLLDEPGQAWLQEHEHRAGTAAIEYYLTAGAALAGLVLPKFWPRTGTPLLAATFLLGCTALGLGVWTASAGGKIRHSEFRYTPPPERVEDSR